MRFSRAGFELTDPGLGLGRQRLGLQVISGGANVRAIPSSGAIGHATFGQR
jgi:hypothetical protein